MDSVEKKLYFTFTFTATRSRRFEIQLPTDSSKRASLAQKRERLTHARSGILNELASVLATYQVSKNRGAYFDNRVIIIIVIHRDERIQAIGF